VRRGRRLLRRVRLAGDGHGLWERRGGRLALQEGGAREPQASRAVVIAGASLGLSPPWAVVVPDDPTTGRTVYGQDPVASLSVDFEVPGDYVIALEIDVTNGPVDFTDALLGGVLVHSFGPSDGRRWPTRRASRPRAPRC
jgi:hypothetical protein